MAGFIIHYHYRSVVRTIKGELLFYEIFKLSVEGILNIVFRAVVINLINPALMIRKNLGEFFMYCCLMFRFRCLSSNRCQEESVVFNEIEIAPRREGSEQ